MRDIRGVYLGQLGILEAHFTDYIQRAVWTGLSRTVPSLDRKQEVAEEETPIKGA